MAASYRFAIVRFGPDDARDERINVGVLVMTSEGADMRMSRRLEKVRAFSAAVDPSEVKELIENVRLLDERLRAAGLKDEAERYRQLSRVGPISLSNLGTFEAPNAEQYDVRIASIMRAMVDPEPAPFKLRQKRSRLLTQVKRELRFERVLAKPGEGVGSHRVVSSFEIDEGLVADLALKNGAFHIVETVDATSANETTRKALGDIGISALVFERARMRYGDPTSTRLVYSASPTIERIADASLLAAEHQGAQLVNWLSTDDRQKFINSIASLAEPIPTKRSRRAQPMGETLRFI